MSTDPSHRQMGQSVGAKLRAARQAKKYTQSQLATPDFSVSYISAIERGQIHPSLRALEILARRLDLSSTQLLPERSHSEHGVGIVTPPLFDDETATELALLEAHIHILRGTATEAITHLKKLPTRTLHHKHRIRHSYLLGWAYMLTADMPNCEDALSEVERLSIEHNDSYSRLRAFNLLGLAHSSMSNHQQALQAHQRCLELLQDAQPSDPFFLCMVYSHLGQHHSNLNDFPSALHMFKQAIELAQGLATEAAMQSSYWTIAQHYSQAQEHHLASLYSHKCFYLSERPAGGVLKGEIYYYLGRTLLQSDQEKARTFLEDALLQPNNHQDVLSQASLTVCLAEWHFQHGNLSQAAQLSEQAYQLVQPLGESMIAAQALILWGRIDYAQKRCEEGDKHFVAGLEMLENLGLYEESSDQYALYAQLLDEGQRLQEAIAYYKRAFESRRRIGAYN